MTTQAAATTRLDPGPDADTLSVVEVATGRILGTVRRDWEHRNSFRKSRVWLAFDAGGRPLGKWGFPGTAALAVELEARKRAREAQTQEIPHAL